MEHSARKPYPGLITDDDYCDLIEKYMTVIELKNRYFETIINLTAPGSQEHTKAKEGLAV